MNASEDPDATRLLPQADPPSFLPPGTRLREFEVRGVIGEGGFSIVYEAQDVNLQRRVALKEYMPAALSFRRGDRTVLPRSARDAETFDLGRRSFINEARLLARFDHRALVKVHQFWEDNGTAYMVMPLYEGKTLKQWLNDQGQPPSEEWIKNLLAPLLDAVEHLHAEKVYHRDIAPDNVLVLNDGLPLLLDFGSARQVIGDAAQALTAIVKASYAPIEQYAGMANLPQGPWTDVYAMCAVLYFAVSGKSPPPAVARSITDQMVPASKIGEGRFSRSFLQGIDAGLAVRPEVRPRSISQLRTLLFGDGPPSVAAGIPSTGFSVSSEVARRSGEKYRTLTVLVGLGAVAVGVAIWVGLLYGPASSSDPANQRVRPQVQDENPGAPGSNVGALPPIGSESSSAISTIGTGSSLGTVPPQTSEPTKGATDPKASDAGKGPADTVKDKQIPATSSEFDGVKARAAQTDVKATRPEPSRTQGGEAAARRESKAKNPICSNILLRWSIGELSDAQYRLEYEKEGCLK